MNMKENVKILKEKGSKSIVVMFGFVICVFMSLTQGYAANYQAISQEKSLKISGDSSIGFLVSKLGFLSVDGVFRDFSGDLKLNGEEIVSLSGEVKIASVFTDNKKRDAHLLESDFFDAKAYPTSTFVMTKYERLEGQKDNGEIRGKVYGELSLHGVKLPLELSSVLNLNTSTLTLTGELNVKDFGIKGSKVNSDKVELNFKTLWH